MGADKSTFEFDCWMYSLKFSFVAFLVERTQNEDKTTFKSPTAIPPPGVKPCPPKKFRPFLGSSDIAEGLVPMKVKFLISTKFYGQKVTIFRNNQVEIFEQKKWAQIKRENERILGFIA